MKRVILIAFLILIMTMNNTTMAQNTIKLPAPATTGGMPLNEALATRHSVREYDSTRLLTDQQLSDMLWCAAGVNRPDSKMRTNPTAMNTQEIDLYLFTAEGVYLYDPFANTLEKKAEGDHRSLVAGNAQFTQDFVMDAPVSVVMVADVARFETPAQRNTAMACIDAGIVSENICLYCASEELATVPRVTMDAEGIQTLLGLPATSMPIINNPIGYAK